MSDKPLDSVYVQIGADTSSYEDGQKKVLDGLKKIDDQSSKSNEKKEKAEKESGKRLTEQIDGLGKLSLAFLGVGSVVAGITSIAGFSVNMANQNANLSRNADLLTMNTNTLKAWGAVAKEVGGSEEGITNTFLSLNGAIAALKQGTGGAAELQALSQIAARAQSTPAFDLVKGEVDILKLSDQLKKIKETEGDIAAFNLAKSLNMDSGTYQTLTRGASDLNDALKKQEALISINVDRSRELQKAHADLTSAWDAFTNKIADGVALPLIKMMTAGINGNNDGKIENEFDYINKNAKPIAEPVIPKNETKQQKAARLLENKGWSKEQAAGIVGNLERESGLDTAAIGDHGQAVGMAQWHPDRQKDFKKMMRKELSQASFEEQIFFVDWELKNTEKKAGDLLKQTKTPAEAASVFAKYAERPKDKEGEALKRGVLAEDIYRGLSPQINNMSSMVGAGNVAPIPSASAKNEITTNINAINVVSHATNAPDLVKDMKAALNDNSLITAGMYALQ